MKVKHLNENQVKFLDSAEFRIQRYEDYISELFHKVHDGYMNGMVNAKAYADVLAKIYSVLETLDYVDEPLKESYMDVHEGMNHMNTLDMMAALKSVVKEYGHMELVTPIHCEIKNDDHGRRLALIPTTNEGLVEDSKVKDAKFAGTTNEADEDGIMDEPEWVDTLSEGAEKLHTKRLLKRLGINEKFDTAEHRIERYEYDIPELMTGMHDDYMEGKLDAARYAEALKKVYDALSECDYKYTMSVPIVTNGSGKRVLDALDKLDKTNESVENGTEDDYDDDYSNDYDESLEECSGIKAHKVIMGEA